MTTLPEWYQDEAKMSHLNDLLRDPVLNLALGLVEKANTPGFRAGVAVSDLALVHSFQAGIHHVRRALVALTYKPDSVTNEAGEWEGDHVIPTQPTETE
jgi:hypothetical protein